MSTYLRHIRLSTIEFLTKTILCRTSSYLTFNFCFVGDHFIISEIFLSLSNRRFFNSQMIKCDNHKSPVIRRYFVQLKFVQENNLNVAVIFILCLVFAFKQSFYLRKIGSNLLNKLRNFSITQSCK